MKTKNKQRKDMGLHIDRKKKERKQENVNTKREE
jgi:hypothetical protein